MHPSPGHRKDIQRVGSLRIHVAEKERPAVLLCLLVVPGKGRGILRHLHLSEILERDQARARHERVALGRGDILVHRHHRVGDRPHPPPPVHVGACQVVAHIFDHRAALVVQVQGELIVLRQQVRPPAHNQRPGAVALPAAKHHHPLVPGERGGRGHLRTRRPRRARGCVEQRPVPPAHAIRIPVGQVQQQGLGLLSGLRLLGAEIEPLQQGPVAGHRLPFGRRPVPRKRVRIAVGRDAPARPDHLRVFHAEAHQARMVEHVPDADRLLHAGVIAGRAVLAGIVVVKQFGDILKQRARKVGIHLRILVISPVPADHVLEEHLEGAQGPGDELGPVRGQADGKERAVSVQLVVLQVRQLPFVQVIVRPPRLGEQIVHEHPLDDILADAHVAPAGRSFVHAGVPRKQVERLQIQKALPLHVAGLGLHPPHHPLLSFGDVQRPDRRGGQRRQRVVDQQRLFREPALPRNRISQGQVQQRVVRRPAGPVGIGPQAARDKAVPHRDRREPLALVIKPVAVIVERRAFPALRIRPAARRAERAPRLGHIAPPRRLAAGRAVPHAAKD